MRSLVDDNGQTDKKRHICPLGKFDAVSMLDQGKRLTDRRDRLPVCSDLIVPVQPVALHLVRAAWPFDRESEMQDTEPLVPYHRHELAAECRIL